MAQLLMEQPRPIPWTPLAVVHLPFEWPEPPKQVRNHPPEPPPIAHYLARNPWFLPKLLSRNVPD